MNLRKDHYRNSFFIPRMKKRNNLKPYERIKSPWQRRAAFSAMGGADDCPGDSTRTGLRVKERNTGVGLSGVTTTF